jgi:hypothetical protein
MALSATLKLGQTWKSMKSTTAPRPGPGAAEQPVDEVAARAAEQQPERSAQPVLPQPAGHPQDHDDHDDGDRGEQQRRAPARRRRPRPGCG